MNSLCLSGFVGKDKEIVKEGKIAKFSLAVEDNYFNKEKNEWVNGTMWIDCMLFGNSSSRTVNKGDLVEIVGSLKINNWKDSNDKWHNQTQATVNSLKVIVKKGGSDSNERFHKNNVSEPKVEAEEMPF